jgi:hypothetical protein
MELYKLFNEEVILRYIKKILPEIFINNRTKRPMFQCPLCLKGRAAHFIPNSAAKMFCPACATYATPYQLVRKIEKDKVDYTNNQIVDYLSNLLDVNVVSESLADYYLELYKNYGFDLIPLIKNDKKPIETGYQEIVHKDINEWKEWIDTKGLNIAVKCGIKSNLTVVELDTKELPDIFKNIPTLIEETRRGFHFFFKYDEELTNKDFRITTGDPIEVFSNKKFVVVAPSATGGFTRKHINDNNISEIPKELKEWLLKCYRKTKDEPITQDIVNQPSTEVDTPNNIATLKEGDGRNNFLVHLGGILKKELSFKQIEFTIDLINQKFFSPPLNETELKALKGSLNKYIKYDEKDLAIKLINHLRLVEFGSSKDLAESLHEKKELIEKALAYLINNECVYKRGRNYALIPKMVWKTDLLNLGKQLDFEIKFFSKLNIFNFGDMVILGLKTGHGKTTIAANLIRDFVDQGKSVDYFCNEPGGRFAKILLNLGIKEGDFRYGEFCDPEEVVIERDRISIIDWLLPTDYAQTDKLFKAYNRQLLDKGGFLIVFMQLKDDGGWYSKEMVKFFATLAARYFYEENSREFGYWVIDKMRERKVNVSDGYKIPCRYDFETKELVEITPNEIRNGYDDTNKQDSIRY